MLKAMVQTRGIFSKGGKWIDMDWNDFLLAPSWIFTQAKGYSMAWLNNFKDVARSLEWRENTRYFKDSAIQWSPWMSPLRIIIASEDDIKRARLLHNVGIHKMLNCWDSKELSWKESSRSIIEIGINKPNLKELINDLQSLVLHWFPPLYILDKDLASWH